MEKAAGKAELERQPSPFLSLPPEGATAGPAWSSGNAFGWEEEDGCASGTSYFPAVGVIPAWGPTGAKMKFAYKVRVGVRHFSELSGPAASLLLSPPSYCYF